MQKGCNIFINQASLSSRSSSITVGKVWHKSLIIQIDQIVQKLLWLIWLSLLDQIDSLPWPFALKRLDYKILFLSSFRKRDTAVDWSFHVMLNIDNSINQLSAWVQSLILVFSHELKRVHSSELRNSWAGSRFVEAKYTRSKYRPRPNTRERALGWGRVAPSSVNLNLFEASLLREKTFLWKIQCCLSLSN